MHNVIGKQTSPIFPAYTATYYNECMLLTKSMISTKIGFCNLGTQLILLGDSTQTCIQGCDLRNCLPKISHIFRGVAKLFRMKLNFLPLRKATYCWWFRYPAPVEVGRSHYLQGFIHPKWLFGISSINTRNSLRRKKSQRFFPTTRVGVVTNCNGGWDLPGTTTEVRRPSPSPKFPFPKKVPSSGFAISSAETTLKK